MANEVVFIDNATHYSNVPLFIGLYQLLNKCYAEYVKLPVQTLNTVVY